MKISNKKSHKVSNWKQKNKSRKNKRSLDAAKRLDPIKIAVFTSFKDIR